MALDQSLANWAAYQNDPTKAFVGGQWVDNTNPATQPGHGTINDKIGAYFDIGGKPKYMTWAELAPQYGDPRTVAGGNISTDAGDFTTPNQLTRNDSMPALWDPKESFFAPFMGALKDLGPFAALTGIGGGLNALAQGGSFLSNAGGVLGDAWNGLSGGVDAPWGVNKAAEGGNVAYDPFSFTPDPTMPGGISEPFTGSGFPALGGDYTVSGVLPAGLEQSEGYLKLIKELGPTAAKGLIGKLMSGEGSVDDYAKLAGVLGSTALGIYGSNQQASALERIAEQSRTDRAPFLAKSMEWLNDPAAYAAGPGKSALDATLRALSVQGNPIGNPGQLAIAGDIANRGWQNAVTGFGNLGLSGSDSRNQLLASAAGADRGVTTALSSGLGELTQPQNSLEELIKRLQAGGVSLA